MHAAPVKEPPRPLDEVRGHVRTILAASPAFRALPAERQAQLAHDMVHAADAAAHAIARSSRRPSPTVQAVDFPTFVANLIQGTFNAIVDASIEQMEAYTRLLESVAKPLDEFMHDLLCDDDRHSDEKTRKRLAQNRQQILSTMVLMGINRIVVTEGRISAGVNYDFKRSR
jgi:hypothetical protein